MPIYIYTIYIYIQYEKCMIFIIAINPASLEVGLVGHYGGNGLDRLATGSTGCCGLDEKLTGGAKGFIIVVIKMGYHLVMTFTVCHGKIHPCY
jgi:hypothetical protein